MVLSYFLWERQGDDTSNPPCSQAEAYAAAVALAGAAAKRLEKPDVLAVNPAIRISAETVYDRWRL
jgi:hypothetical protein